MKKITIMSILVVLVVGCGTNKNRELAPKVFIKAPTSVVIKSVIPYQAGHKIKSTILNECQLNTKLAMFIIQAAKEKNLNVKTRKEINKDDKGSVLIVEITESVSEGNAFIGHRKSTTVGGTLYNDGVKLASFRAKRNSGGGAFSGFKGSCSVLGRTVETLGLDIVLWLKKPWKNGMMGDI